MAQELDNIINQIETSKYDPEKIVELVKQLRELSPSLTKESSAATASPPPGDPRAASDGVPVTKNTP